MDRKAAKTAMVEAIWAKLLSMERDGERLTARSAADMSRFGTGAYDSLRLVLQMDEESGNQPQRCITVTLVARERDSYHEDLGEGRHYTWRIRLDCSVFASTPAETQDALHGWRAARDLARAALRAGEAMGPIVEPVGEPVGV